MPIVAHDDAGQERIHLFERFLYASGQPHDRAAACEDVADELPRVCFVIKDQYTQVE